MRSRLALLLLTGVSLSLPAQAAGQKSDLRVLLVGQDPENPKLAFADMAVERTHELYRERTGAFEELLEQHFENVTVVFAADYEVSMSDSVDVTVFDARPNALEGKVPEAEGLKGPRYLPLEFSRPAVTISHISPGIGESIGLKLDWL